MDERKRGVADACLSYNIGEDFIFLYMSNGIRMDNEIALHFDMNVS